MADPFVAQPIKILDNTSTNVATVSAGGALLVDATFTPSGTQNVNVTQIGGNAVAAGSGAASTGTQRVTIATDDVVSIDDNGGTISIDDGAGSITVDGSVSVTGSVEVTNDSGNPLPISATTSVNSASNPLFSQLTDGTAAFSASNPLPVTFEGSNDGTLVDSNSLTSAALAAGASADLDSANIGAGLTGKLLSCHASSSVALRVELKRVEGSTTTSRVFFVEARTPFVYTVPDRDAITVAGGVSGRNFRMSIKNMDNNKAADVYGSFTYETV